MTFVLYDVEDIYFGFCSRVSLGIICRGFVFGSDLSR